MQYSGDICSLSYKDCQTQEDKTSFRDLIPVLKANKTHSYSISAISSYTCMLWAQADACLKKQRNTRESPSAWGLLLLNVSLARGSQPRVVHLNPRGLRLTHWLTYTTSSYAAPSLSAVLLLHGFLLLRDFLLKASFLSIAGVECKS